jgi:rhamnose transport system permease protein
MKSHTREASVAVALFSMLLVLAVFTPAFYQPVPLLSLLAREAPALVVTCGIVLIIVARQIDISVGSQFALCSVCAGLLMEAHWPLPAVILGAVAIGVFVGAINGALVGCLKLPSIVVTLAMMVTLREGLGWQREGQFINLPPHSQWFGLNQTQGQLAILAIATLCLTVVAICVRHVAIGRHIYAIGTNAEAARLAGLRPRLITAGLFALLGGLCAVAALLNAVQSPQVDPKAGTGLELKVIAASVVGGVAISGGKGNVWGAALGLALLACVGPALIHFHLEAYWERALQGVLILLAVMADSVRVRDVTRQITVQP